MPFTSETGSTRGGGRVRAGRGRGRRGRGGRGGSVAAAADGVVSTAVTKSVTRRGRAKQYDSWRLQAASERKTAVAAAYRKLAVMQREALVEIADHSRAVVLNSPTLVAGSLEYQAVAAGLAERRDKETAEWTNRRRLETELSVSRLDADSRVTNEKHRVSHFAYYVHYGV